MKRFVKMVFLLALTLAMVLQTALTASAAPTGGSVTVRGCIVDLSGGGDQKYCIIYDANGGVGVFVGPEITSGGTDTVLTSAATGIVHPDGHAFTGWNTKANGSGISYDPGDTITLTGNVTLYAQWKSSADDSIHYSYMNGYPDGTFHPDNAITRSETAADFYRMLTGGQGADTESAGFDDVAGGAWYADAVNYLAGIGAVSGYPDGSFKPDQVITRAEFVTIAARINNLSSTAPVNFTDVDSGHWAYAYINAAYESGWINGYPDNTFCPERPITRAETVRIINVKWGRAADVAALERVTCPFSDVPTSHWAYAEIIEASVTHAFQRDKNGAEVWK